MRKNREKIRADVLFANIAGSFAVLLYGVMRLTETLTMGGRFPFGVLVFAMCCGTSALMITFQLILRNSRLVPMISGLLPLAAFSAGAIAMRDFDYYYIAMLCAFGIVCLYQRWQAAILYFLINLMVSVTLFLTIFRMAGYAAFNKVAIDALLFIYGSFCLMVMTFRATSRENRADAGLKAFDSLLRSTPNMMAIIDAKKRVRYLSAPFAKFAGMSASAAVGRPFLDLFAEESIGYMFADILDADEFFEDTREIEVGGEKRYFKIISDQLLNSGESMFIEITDVTQTVATSIRAEEARLEAEQANRSKSQFLATMSHEIRTPMNAILGIAQIELNSGALSDKQAAAINKIYASGHSLLGIINDILDLSKIETGKLEMNPAAYDLPSLIHDAVQLNIVRIGSKPIEFILDADASLPSRMVGDELRIKQVLNNILSNALKYTDSGSVTMAVTHEAADAAQYLVFKVTDTGQGMTQEQVARLFDEYSRFNAEANRGTEGTGLGMNITRRLVKLMAGDIRVESAFGKGSVFTVRLKQGAVDCPPIGQELAGQLAAFSFSGAKEDARLQFTRENMSYGKVLVVDDVNTNLYVAEGLLMPYGLQTETATSGVEAIEKIKCGSVYDIVFMDHMMPVMDGLEATRQIRELGYAGTIIALTANAIAGNAEIFKANGFDDFLSKPIDMRQLNAALNQYVRKKLPPPKAEAARPGVSPALMKIFVGDAAKAVVTLRETMANGDMQLFATTAHAMKAACANVGEGALSALAAGLEDAAKQGDEAFIAANARGLIERLSAFDAPEAEPGPVAETTEEDEAFLREKMAEIQAALNDFDSGEALRVVALLKERKWPAEVGGRIDVIEEAAMFSDFDKAAELCAAYSG